ncbi:cystine ABC transporter substrate-binding protein [Caulobacter segnis]|uniref:Extracellular solute-binding protein family 3 n=2 Tax=Caulobacter segnis TaxID=88688 RepID=D5VJI7_CAUST|nr:cystine ABC transporter substrate-binding protein [Caulobacter segnis]ADG10396.1 extracellular solute-binding protein family 3 [Caulobacter segnis ATCC 21756]AVQ02126.1 cystine ABC transporter substrate-binding protein [Caulobacter segnis]
MRFPARRAVISGLGLALLAACGKKPDSDVSGWDRIKASGTLRIGLEGTYPPFNFQGADGQLTGFEVDFAKALAAQLGLKPEFRPAPFAGLLGALESGRVDVVINQITITPDRKDKYDFSEPYTISGIQIITLKAKPGPSNPDELAGKKVGVGLGTNYEQWLRANVPTADVRTYDDDPTKYQDLKAGRIDAVLNDRLVAADFVKTSPEFVASGPPFAAQGAGVAMKKDAALKVIIDQAIDALRASGKLSAMSQQWFGMDVTR